MALIPVILAPNMYTILQTIGNLSVDIYSLTKSIYAHNDADICEIIRQTDIYCKLTVIKSIISTIHWKPIFKESNSVDFSFCLVEKPINDPVQICLFYLQEAIEKIHDDLVILNAKIIKHRTKWLNYWRRLNVQPIINIFLTDCHLLQSRFDDLTKITAFLKTKDICLN